MQCSVAKGNGKKIFSYIKVWNQGKNLLHHHSWLTVVLFDLEREKEEKRIGKRKGEKEREREEEEEGGREGRGKERGMEEGKESVCDLLTGCLAASNVASMAAI